MVAMAEAGWGQSKVLHVGLPCRSQRPKQKAESEVEQSGQELATTWSPGVAGGSVMCYATMLAAERSFQSLDCPSRGFWIYAYLYQDISVSVNTHVYQYISPCVSTQVCRENKIHLKGLQWKTLPDISQDPAWTLSDRDNTCARKRIAFKNCVHSAVALESNTVHCMGNWKQKTKHWLLSQFEGVSVLLGLGSVGGEVGTVECLWLLPQR